MMYSTMLILWVFLSTLGLSPFPYACTQQWLVYYIHDNCLSDGNNDDETLGNFCKRVLKETSNRTMLQAEGRIGR